MEYREIVIRISEEDYLTFSKLSEKEKTNELSFYERIIANGTPLPKGHGRLKDIDKIEKLLDLDKPNNVIAENIKKIIDTIPTLIGADKE